MERVEAVSGHPAQIPSLTTAPPGGYRLCRKAQGPPLGAFFLSPPHHRRSKQSQGWVDFVMGVTSFAVRVG